MIVLAGASVGIYRKGVELVLKYQVCYEVDKSPK